MKQSQLFTKTSKEIPADEEARNAQLLLKAGFIHKEMAGVYAFLPLGLRVTEKIKQIMREEMDAVGGQEMHMTSLQPKDVWEQTDRWDNEKVDVWFKTKLQNGKDVGLAWSHEEPITKMMKEFISSYRDLPRRVYQFQIKLRNELRAKSGIMRTREFEMKDLYSYSKNEEEHEKIYQEMRQAYHRIFERVGIGEDTFYTFASGGAFTDFSHEFQTVTDAGEDVIYVDRKRNLAVNKEVYNDEVLEKLGLKKDELEEVKASEVGNIFNFGTVKTEELGLYFTDEEGNKTPVTLGSYGIGVGRLMGVIVEHFADDSGMIWPKSVAPFSVHMVSINSKKEDVQSRVQNVSEDLYNELTDAGIEVLWDDRDAGPGEKLKDADLIGIPLRLVISEKTLAEDSVEWKERHDGDMDLMKLADIKDKVEAFANEDAAK